MGELEPRIGAVRVDDEMPREVVPVPLAIALTCPAAKNGASKIATPI